MTVPVLLVVCLTTLWLTPAAAATSTSSPALSVQGDAAAGHVTVQWRAAGNARGTEFQLQQSPTGDFRAGRVRYQGPHHASVLSGLPNGSYYFRVRARATAQHPWGPWSAPELFSVQHHPLALAVLMLGIGALVLGLTLGFLLVFAARTGA